MGKKSLSFLIFCAIMTQGTASLSKENITVSSNLQVRQKRLIDRVRNGGIIMSFQQTPYIVNLLKDYKPHCGATILSYAIVLSAAHCFNNKSARYSILSGSSLKNDGTYHSILKTIKHPDYNPHTLINNLILMRVSPNIKLGLGLNEKIELYDDCINTKSIGIFSGWGCTHTIPSVKYPDQLRSIYIPILVHQFCQDYYRGIANILEQNVCALDKTGNTGSCDGDEGGPLVVERKLVGIMSYRKGDLDGTHPEVFMNVAHSEIQEWIISTMQNYSNWYGLIPA